MPEDARPARRRRPLLGLPAVCLLLALINVGTFVGLVSLGAHGRDWAVVLAVAMATAEGLLLAKLSKQDSRSARWTYAIAGLIIVVLLTAFLAWVFFLVTYLIFQHQCEVKGLYCD